MASETARRLRREATEAERLLWLALRDRRLAGYKFRRQRPIGPYVADFVSIRYRLIIEVDGSQHAASEADEKRTAWLARYGWRVIRVWDNDVSENADAVAEYLLHVLQTQPTLTLPSLPRWAPLSLPQAGEGLKGLRQPRRCAISQEIAQQVREEEGDVRPQRDPAFGAAPNGQARRG
jgi:very-short-patch-repair endonuclease